MLSLSPQTIDLDHARPHNADWIGTPIRARKRFRLDHIEGVIGSGDAAFAAAREAMRRWDMARQSWTEILPEEPEIRPGTQLAVVARLGPIWTASIGKITATESSTSRFAFSYGTTNDHVAMGEEQFAVEQFANGDVVFSITAVSRPARWWAWLGYPLLRWSQARFRRGALRAMRQAVAAQK